MSEKEPEVARYCFDYRDLANALPFNAVASISITANFSDGRSPVLCTLHRSVGTCNEPLIYDHDRVRDTIPPARPPSALPPPGHLSLHLQINDKVGRGRAGGVYGVTIDFDSDKSSPELATHAVPPLVAKISRPGQHARVEHEAYYYDEMECIQGVVVPRCYGLFTGEIPAGSSLFPNTDSDASSHSHGNASSINLDERDSGVDDDGADDTVGSIDSDGRNESTKPPLGTHVPVAVLLLERLGDRLPVGKELPKDIKAEVLEMYSHLAELGVDHVDIRYANILEAPVCPPGWPSLVSPMTGHPYRFRIVDFDNSRKTNLSLKVFAAYHRGYVVRMLDGLMLGYIIEPWHL